MAAVRGATRVGRLGWAGYERVGFVWTLWVRYARLENESTGHAYRGIQMVCVCVRHRSREYTGVSCVLLLCA